MLPTYKTSSRRFGVEIEYNAYDGESRSRGENDLPVGIYSVANIIRKFLNKSVDVTKWQYTHNNIRWAVKPDSSCGIEVCSPPLRGMSGINQIREVIEALTQKSDTKADYRCSFHIHVEIADLTENQIVLLMRNWIRFELFFFLLCNPFRWLNQYCIPVGFFNGFDSKQNYFFSNLLHKFSEYKYFSVNLYHYGKGKKKTIEFRVMGNEACMNPDDAENWCKLMLCFVDTCSNYAGMSQTNLEYGDLDEALEFLQLSHYFESNEMFFWMIEKLSNLIDKTDFEAYSRTKYFWQSFIETSQEEIKDLVEKLETDCL